LKSIGQSKYWEQNLVLRWPESSVAEKIIKQVRHIRCANLLFAVFSFNRKASAVKI
jgi:hypothetical protein